MNDKDYRDVMRGAIGRFCKDGGCGNYAQLAAVCRYLRGEVARLTHYHIENSTGGDDCIFIDLSEDLE